MTSNQKITIIVPVFNSEAYLQKCFDSLINQSYQNIEFLIINDGSSDQSENIINEYCIKDERFIHIKQPTNKGVSEARNLGIAKASGQYIGFVDSDDYIEHDMFEVLLNAINSTKADMARCNAYTVDETGKALSNIDPISPQDNNICFSRDEAILNLGIGTFHSHLCLCLFSKDLFNDISFPEKKTYEDSAIMFLIISKIERLVYVPKSMYFYFQRAKSITKDSINLPDQLLAYINRYQYYLDNFNLYEANETLMGYCFLAYIALRMRTKEKAKDHYSYMKKEVKIHKYKIKKHLPKKLAISYFLNKIGITYNLQKKLLFRRKK